MAEDAVAGKEDKFVVFEKWLKENGASYPKLYLKDYGGEMRGCHTHEDIEPEETIIDIPLSCLITVEMGQDTEIGKLVREANISLDAPKHVYIMLYMLVDRLNPNSFFKPYYDILPPTLSNMPIFWSKEELEMLKGSYLLAQIDERNEAIANDYDQICEIYPSFVDICTLDEFKWARMCVSSRNFGMQINGVRTAAMVPFADMLNHYRPRETRWQFEDMTQSFTVVSLQDIFVGAQVYDSYGQKCNHRFLLNYGFSVENNVEQDGFCPNEVPVCLELNEVDPVYEAKLSYWLREGNGTLRKVIRVCVSDNDNTRCVLGLMRFIVADLQEVDILLISPEQRLLHENAVASGGRKFGGISGFRSLRHAQQPLSIKNEVNMWKFFLGLIQQMLSSYPTAFEQDVYNLSLPTELPESSSSSNSCAVEFPLFSNKRNALIQVKGEKEVLLFYKDMGETALQVLNTWPVEQFLSKEFFELLDSIQMNKHFLIYNYCRSVAAKLLKEEHQRNELKIRNMNLALPTVV